MKTDAYFERLFAYGTLRRGFRNHVLLGNATFISEGRTQGMFALYVDRVPYVIRSEQRTRIAGEVYDVTPFELEAIDRLEEHPRRYCRERTCIVLNDGRETSAWLYFYPRKQGALIVSGDFTELNGLRRREGETATMGLLEPHHAVLNPTK